MKLAEAVKCANAPQPTDETPLNLAVVCGFEPLHLKTFLTAYLRRDNPDRAVALEFGLYEGLFDFLQELADQPTGPVAVILEWSDLDLRLGYRASADLLGQQQDILDHVTRQLARLKLLIGKIAARSRLCFVGPLLPLPSHLVAGSGQIGVFEAKLRYLLSGFEAELADLDSVSLLYREARTDDQARVSFKSLLTAGYPYSLEETDQLAELVCAHMTTRPAMKGIITDLDNTLWRGILGDDGVDGVSWNQDQGSQNHGLYQQLLGVLAEQGILVAISSKNEQELVEQALARQDLLLAKDNIFPVKASWGQKSQAVAEILTSWNILPDSVVFIDDNQVELEEVSTAFPELTCLQFPTYDPDQVVALLSRLRDMFVFKTAGLEDRLRLSSLKANAEFEAGLVGGGVTDQEAFLLNCAPELTIEFTRSDSGGRPFELLNKTNQFNLNGARMSAADWDRGVMSGDLLLMTASYADKFGPLGSISTMLARPSQQGEGMEIMSWVMSCRAFSRRIEFQMLDALFSSTGCREVLFDYRATGKNKPFAKFMDPLFPGGIGEKANLNVAEFRARCPRLYHKVTLKE